MLTIVLPRLLIAGGLIVMMFSLGLELGARPPASRSEKRHERLLLVRALVVNLVLLPLFAYLLLHGLHRSGMISEAVLLVAATPGGRFAPRIAKLARADLQLAVELTLFLAKLTPLTAPITIKWLLGGPHVDLKELVLIAQLLVTQMLPYLIGRWVRRHHPTVAARLTRPLGWLEAALFVAIFAVLLARGDLQRLHTVPSLDWLAGLAFAVLALVVGWVTGGPSAGVRRACATTAAARNMALALLIAGELFPGSSVQLALLAIWLICLGADLIFAGLARALEPGGFTPWRYRSAG